MTRQVSVYKKTIKIIIMTLVMACMFIVFNIQVEARTYGAFPYELFANGVNCPECGAKDTIYIVYYYTGRFPESAYFKNPDGTAPEFIEPYHCTIGSRYINACRNPKNRRKMDTSEKDGKNALVRLWEFHATENSVAWEKDGWLWYDDFMGRAFDFSILGEGDNGNYCGQHGTNSRWPTGHFYDGHEKRTEIEKATCGHAGETRKDCTFVRCEHSITLKEPARLEHEFDKYTKEPNNGLKEGYRYHQCTRGKLCNEGKDAKGNAYQKDFQYKVHLTFDEDKVEATANEWYDKNEKNVKISAKAKDGYKVLGFIHKDSSSDDKTGNNFIIDKMTKAHWWEVQVSSLYSIKYKHGVTNINQDNVIQNNLVYKQSVTLKLSNTFKGSKYTLKFNLNENTYDEETSTCSTHAEKIDDITGNLEFKQWKFDKAPDKTIYTIDDTFEAGQKIESGEFTSKPNGVAELKATYKEKTIKLDKYTPTRKGYKFIGWYNKATGGTKLDSVTFKPSSENIDKTIYAHWKPITYKVRFNGNGNWNTDQKAYIQTLTFDKKEVLEKNKFTRTGGEDKDWSTYDIENGYSFRGWTQTENSWTKEFSNCEEKVFNLSNKQDSIIDLYAIWRKKIKLNFNFNGGTFNNKSDTITLSGYIWNTRDTMTLKLDGTLTPENENKNNKQENSLKIYGNSYNSNGINSSITKTDQNGQEYRFLGWNTDKNATEPLKEYDIYSTSHKISIKLPDTLTLYAIYEPILTGQIKTERVLGDLGVALKKQDIATAVKQGKTELIIRPGEQAQYTAISKGTDSELQVIFDNTITNIYNNQGLWTDTLNKNPSLNGIEVDGVSLYTTHGLNRKIQLQNNTSTIRKFNIPQYLGTNSSEPSSIGKDNYIITFTFTNNNSYYYNKYKGTKEKATIITNIKLITTKPIQDTIKTRIENKDN